MAIDIRAVVTSNLGPVISASVSDGYIQGGGLIQTRGRCEIKGLVTPSIGSKVWFYYTKDGVTRTVPRTLRVLSCFADPFRNKTTIQLGCKFTYLQNEAEREVWVGEGDERNPNAKQVSRIGSLSYVRASIAAAHCLNRLSIGGSLPSLESIFYTDNFSYDAGYVSVLSGLLASELYCGYLDQAEGFRYFSVDVVGGSGPVFDASSLIDIGPIGSGEQPGSSVVVKYRNKRLQAATPDGAAVTLDPLGNVLPGVDPDSADTPASEVDDLLFEPAPPSIEDDGSYSDFQSNVRTSDVPIAYQLDGDTEPRYAIYRSVAAISTRTIYKPHKSGGYLPSYRETSERRIAAESASNYVAQLLSLGRDIGATPLTTTTREYMVYDDEGRETFSKLIRSTSGYALLGALSLPAADDTGAIVTPPNENFIIEEIDTNTRYGERTQTVTVSRYGPWAFTLAGQQAIATASSSYSVASQVETLLDKLLGSQHLLDFTVTTSDSNRPSASNDPNSSTLAVLSPDDADKGDGSTSEGSAQQNYDTGAEEGETGNSVEFDLPYAPDDVLEGIGTPNPVTGEYLTMQATQSKAALLAKRYGDVQNRMRRGNRDGMFLQVPPDVVPSTPFAPIYVQLGGLTGLYRLNGTTWTMNAEGIVCSVDAMFWGGVGGAGTPWFPVAPGVTTLPATPAITDTGITNLLGSIATVGADPQATLAAAFPDAEADESAFDEATNQFWTFDGGVWVNVGETPGKSMNASTVIPPWNVTQLVLGKVRTIAKVASVPYALSGLTTLDPLRIRSTTFVGTVLPMASLQFAAVAPAISTGFSVASPDCGIRVSSLTPTVATGVSFAIPVCDMQVSALLPENAGPDATAVKVNAFDIAVAAATPVVVSGTSVAVPTNDLTMAAVAPSSAGSEADPYFSNVELLLHMDGSDNGTTFTDSSSNAFTITRNTAVTSATQVKFGTASLYSASGSANINVTDAVLAPGTSDFTAECWIYITTPVLYGRTIFSWDNGSASLALDYDSGVIKFRQASTLRKTGTTTVPTDQWVHIAFVRSGTNHYLYINGVSEWTPYSTSAGYSNTRWRIAGDGSTTALRGYLDEFRLTIGVARYTSNFTPPAAAFPNS